jgi:E3 ubiquitin-protein ligase UBR3
VALDKIPELLEQVSDFLLPSGVQQGRYCLKEECWAEVDLYHPHWVKRNLQHAQERFHKTR